MFPFSHESQPPTVSAAAGDNSNNCSCKLVAQNGEETRGGGVLTRPGQFQLGHCARLSKFIQFKKAISVSSFKFLCFSLPVVLHLSLGTCCLCTCSMWQV